MKIRAVFMKCCLKADTADSDLMSTIHIHCPARHCYVPVHENPEAASVKWSRMLYFCTSRSVLLSTELHFLRSCEQQNLTASCHIQKGVALSHTLLSYSHCSYFSRFTSCDFGTTPTDFSATFPFLNTSTVGMFITP